MFVILLCVGQAQGIFLPGQSVYRRIVYENEMIVCSYPGNGTRKLDHEPESTLGIDGVVYSEDKFVVSLGFRKRCYVLVSYCDNTGEKIEIANSCEVEFDGNDYCGEPGVVGTRRLKKELVEIFYDKVNGRIIDNHNEILECGELFCYSQRHFYTKDLSGLRIETEERSIRDVTQQNVQLTLVNNDTVVIAAKKELRVPIEEVCRFEMSGLMFLSIYEYNFVKIPRVLERYFVPCVGPVDFVFLPMFVDGNTRSRSETIVPLTPTGRFCAFHRTWLTTYTGIHRKESTGVSYLPERGRLVFHIDNFVQYSDSDLVGVLLRFGQPCANRGSLAGYFCAYNGYVIDLNNEIVSNPLLLDGRFNNFVVVKPRNGSILDGAPLPDTIDLKPLVTWTMDNHTEILLYIVIFFVTFGALLTISIIYCCVNKFCECKKKSIPESDSESIPMVTLPSTAPELPTEPSVPELPPPPPPTIPARSPIYGNILQAAPRPQPRQFGTPGNVRMIDGMANL